MMLLAGLPYIEKSDLYTAHANSSEATFQHHGQLQNTQAACP